MKSKCYPSGTLSILRNPRDCRDQVLAAFAPSALPEFDLGLAGKHEWPRSTFKDKVKV